MRIVQVFSRRFVLFPLRVNECEFATETIGDGGGAGKRNVDESQSRIILSQSAVHSPLGTTSIRRNNDAIAPSWNVFLDI